MPATAAVELVDNFTLLHDDVLDGDRTRRHRPAAWRVLRVINALFITRFGLNGFVVTPAC
ncbi:polyprenyl synthetase family protein [Saccharothrix saharensis]|uniref:polyprenyl synthetase family protein n=1 Tax=Saccharothrix saharensis TaxID=571190 RepID=UPI0036845A2A